MKKHLMVVIHAVSENQVLRNTETAFMAGADGVFLINYKVGLCKLRELATLALTRFGGKFVGVLPREIDPSRAELAKKDPSKLVKAVADLPLVRAVWVEEVGYVELDGHSPFIDRVHLPRRVQRVLTGITPDMMLFGGVGYQGNEVNDLKLAAKGVAPYLDVLVVRSRDKRDDPATYLSKLASIRQEETGTPLAIAGGVTLQNLPETFFLSPTTSW